MSVRTEKTPGPAPKKMVSPKSSEPVVKAAETRAKGPLVEPSLSALDALDVESLAIGLTTNVRPLLGIAGYVDWRMCGRLSRLILAGTVTGAAGEKVLVPTMGMLKPSRLFLFGWGPAEKLADGATDRMKWMVDVLKTAGVDRVAISLPEPARSLTGLVEQHLIEALGPRSVTVFGPDPLT